MANTIAKKRRTPAQLAAEGFAALVDKLGVADAIRFLHVHDSGHGDYTRERSKWLDELDVRKIRQLMSNSRKRPGTNNQ